MSKEYPWTSVETPLDKPSPARMYDYFLGGYHNFEIDRRAAEQVKEIYPDIALVMQANRAFLRRVVHFLLGQGIEQFLDVGSGIPTVGNVHEVTQQVNPAAQVVYVDIDPIAVAHSAALLQDNPHATVLQADARRPAHILNHPDVQRLIDPSTGSGRRLSRPVGLLLVAVLHFITDEAEAYATVRAFRKALAPGSYIAISHATYEKAPREVVEQGEKLYAGSTSPSKVHTREQIERFFAGLDLVAPGVVHLPRWRPEGPEDVLIDAPERSLGLAGVGRVPRP